MANLPAAASCSTASSSTSASSSGYDVFINHRGPDTKKKIASHLYFGLLRCGLRVFLDKQEMEKGDEIQSQIVQAIRDASVHIAIFSRSYAESHWCLAELVLMKNSGATIIPIFYEVDPSVVRWTENGAYAEALRGLEQKTKKNPETGEVKPRYGSDTIQNWRDALSRVADLSGFTLLGDQDDEGEVLDKVVENVLKKIPKTPLDVAKYPTGLELKLEEFEKIVLSQQQQEEERVEAKVVGIVGVGGVGKTTLAKEFFNSHRSRYNASSFLSDVREVTGRISLEYLQSQLLQDLKHMETKIGRHEGIGQFKKHLSLCHALIILDDVDHAIQLEAFLPLKNIMSPNSLILVASRNKHVLKTSGILESSIYNLEGLDMTQSKKLFCSYAFNQPQFAPPEFSDLVDQFVTACKGLPLSLKVIGALLCGENDKSYWQEQLDRLNHALPQLPEEIFETLKISYDSLDKQDKPIFLDIACFFIGEDIEKGKGIWRKAGLTNLRNKCLLEVDTENKIKMHDHIRDMGRMIAEEPTMPRRLWNSTTISNILVEQQSALITEVRGIKMVSSYHDVFQNTLMDHWYPRMRSGISPSHCLGMKNLELVAAEGDHLEDMLRRVQRPNLRWLRWYRSSHSSLPDWIPMENIRVLEVEGERLNIPWPHQSQGVPLQLRELNIFAPLSDIPKSIGQLKYLERIAIKNAVSLGSLGALKRLPDEFCRLGSLKYFAFRRFSEMVSLPDSFGELTNLQHIDLEGASSLQTLPDSFGKLTRLKHLSLRSCENLTISSGTLGNITTLEYLDLSDCDHVSELPPQVAHQLSLQQLYLSGTKLKELPSVGCNLKVLELGGDLLEVLPPGLGDLKMLETLSLFNSPQLKSLPDSIGELTRLTQLVIRSCGIEYLPRSLLKMNILEFLEVGDCTLQEYPFKMEVQEERETEREIALNKLNPSNYRCMSGLKSLHLSGTKIRELYFDKGVCPNLQELTLGSSELRQIGGLCALPKLRDLQLGDCAKLEGLYGFETLTSLESLGVSQCEKLQSIPGLGQLTNLRRLRVSSCREIHGLPGVEHLTSLESLDVSQCKKLQSIPGLGQLTKLRTLWVSSCREIQGLPGVEHLTSLESLNVWHCEKLQSIPRLGQLTKLRRLAVSSCREIQRLPGVEHLTSLESLNVSLCEKLQSIPGLGQLTKLRELNVRECHGLPELPGFNYLTSLEKLNVGGFQRVKSMRGLGQLPQITELNVSECHEISELSGVEHSTSLEKLNISGLVKLKNIQGLGQLIQIKELDVSGCHEISELSGVEHLTSLEKLNISGLVKLKNIQGLGQLIQIKELDVSGCHEIPELLGLENLTYLKKLNISGLDKLRSIQGLGQLTQIRELNVSKCHEILELSGVEHLTSLEKLNISGLVKLKNIQWLGQMTQIGELDVSGCHEIPELLGLEHLTSLKKLNASGLGKLKSIPGLGQITQIRELNVSECHEILELPRVEHLTSLEKLNVSGLGKLKSIQGLEQLTQIREINVSKCHEISDLPGVEYLISLEIINACECPKLQWREEIVEQLRQQLKEGFMYEKQRKRCSCLEFLQFLCSVFDCTDP